MGAAVFFIFALSLFIDGATDCANSVTGAVSSGVMTVKGAVRMSGAFTFFGCILCGLVFPAVAENTAFCITFPKESAATAALSSLLAVSLWSGLAWVFGIPTSEGHGLICAMGGSALALGGVVEKGAFLLIILSFVPVIFICSVLSCIFVRVFRGITGSPSFMIALLGAVSSFFHGAQDGQKFLALAISAGFLGADRTLAVTGAALCMGAGTLFGGRIIRKMGFEMVDATPRAALAADVGSAFSLAVFTFFGVPASTTHVRMVSLASAVKASGERADGSTVLLLFAAWTATFPVCFGAAYLLSRVILELNL